ncbi:MAG TPA: hypothetical protein VLE51_00605 [Candidatus Saccharimonadales bacterium]|nr:hypothetical protein [Candidatus Saccharimonadales bacterium]
MIRHLKTQKGFSLVEVVLACAIFPLVIVGLTQGFNTVKTSYTISRELNEMYAVLSACPEIDRALEYDSVTSSNNCYPNNSFYAEGGSGNLITYSPSLTVTSTSSLSPSDPLQTIPDSKVIDISVGYQKISAPPLELRMLITRSGIGQQ